VPNVGFIVIGRYACGGECGKETCSGDVPSGGFAVRFLFSICRPIAKSMHRHHTLVLSRPHPFWVVGHWRRPRPIFLHDWGLDMRPKCRWTGNVVKVSLLFETDFAGHGKYIHRTS